MIPERSHAVIFRLYLRHFSSPGSAAQGRRGFVVRFDVVEVFRSALRHDVRPEDIQHVLRNAMVVEEIDEDPTRYLVLGADRAGKVMELVVMDRPQGPAVIHAMPMRAKYRALLPESW